MKKVEAEALRRKLKRNESDFLTSEKLALLELGADPVCQYLKTSLAVYMYTIRDGRIGEVFFHFSRERNVSVTLLNGVRFLQLVLDKRQGKRQMLYEMSVSTAFGAPYYFLGKAMMRREVGRKVLNIV